MDNTNEPYMNATHYEPESAYKYYKDRKEGELFLKCPAFIQSLKNTFIIRAPYDISLEFKNGTVVTDKFDQNFFNKNIDLRHAKNLQPPFVVELMPRYVFVPEGDTSVVLNILQLILQPHKYGFLTGEFNITKWVRPVSYTIEIYDTSEPIVFRRGDPLFMVRFTTADNSVVTLEQGVLTEEIQKVISSCINIKKFVPNLSLKVMYKMAKNYINLMLGKKL